MIEKIPEGSVYCHGTLVRDERTGSLLAPEMCPWWKDLGIVVLNRRIEDAERTAEELREKGVLVRGCAVCDADGCRNECWTGGSTDCRVKTAQCLYLGIKDESEETLLWDQCKICGVKEGEE